MKWSKGLWQRRNDIAWKHLLIENVESNDTLHRSSIEIKIFFIFPASAYTGLMSAVATENLKFYLQNMQQKF